MTTVESFQVVGAVAASAAILALLVPGLRGRSASARHAGAAGVLVGAWLLLVGSLVTRKQFDRLVDRVDGATRIGLLAVGGLVALALAVLLVRLCARRPVIWLVLLAVTLPIRVPVKLGSDLSANLLLPLYLTIGIGLAAWVRGRRAGTFPAERTSSLDLPVAGFAAFALLSTLWSADIHEGTVKIVFFWIPFVLLYRLVMSWWGVVTNPLRAVAVTTVAMACGVALVAIGQYATRTIWWNDTLKQGNVYNRFFRANGIFYDPNILGRYLVLALIAVTAYLVVARRGRDVAVLVAAAAVLAAGLAVTFSRSSALGLLVALALLAIRAFGWRKTVLVGAVLLIGLGAPIVATNANVRDKVTSTERLASTGEGRFRLVGAGVDLWREEPVTGVGLGGFAERYRQTFTKRDLNRTRVFISHTAPITVLAELGTIGAALFLLLCGAAVGVMWRGSRSSAPHGFAVWTVLAMIAAIFVHSLLYSALFEDPYLWFLAAAGAALAVAPLAQPSRSDTAALPVVRPATTSG